MFRIPSRSRLRLEEAEDDQISALIGPSKVVALGESFHHSHQLLEMRARLARALIQTGAVRQILLEAIRPGPGPISDFVGGRRSDGVAALREAGARMWQNRETLAFLTWLRAFNVGHPQDPVSIEGIDILSPGASMRELASRMGPDRAARVIEISKLFDQDGRSDQMAYNGLGGPERAWLKACFEPLEVNLEGPDAASLRRHRLVVLRALEMLDAGSTGWINGFAHRDRALAENAGQAIAGYKRRTLILSHNMHVNAAAWRQPERCPITPMGMLLRQRLGSEYVVVGTTFGAAAFDPPVYGIRTLTACGSGTMDEAMDGQFKLSTLIDLRPAGRIDEAAMMGIDVHGGSTLTYPVFSDAFDLLLHVSKIGNAQPLFDTDLDLNIQAVDLSRSADG